MVGMTAPTGCSAETDDRNIKDTETECESMKHQLVTEKYLIEHCELTEADMEGVNLSEFIAEFELTEDNIDDFNIVFILQSYKEEDVGGLDYEYLKNADKIQGGFREELLYELKTFVYQMNEGTYHESIILDFKGDKGYYGQVVDLLSGNAVPTSEISLTADRKTAFEALLKEAELTQWKSRYEGTSEGTTGHFWWTIYLECENGEVYAYSGSGVLGESVPKNYHMLTEGLKKLFEEV